MLPKLVGAHNVADHRGSPEKIACKSARMDAPSFDERVAMVDEGLSHLPTSVAY